MLVPVNVLKRLDDTFSSSQCPQTPWWHLQFQSMSSNALITPSVPVNVLKRLDDTFSSSQCPQTPWWHLQFQSMSSNALMTPSVPVNVLKRLDDTFNSSQCPQTPWWHLQFAQAPQSTLRPSWSSLKLRFVIFFKGAFVSEFQQNCRGWTPDHGSSATLEHLQHLTYKFALQINMLILRAKKICRRITGGEFTLTSEWLETWELGTNAGFVLRWNFNSAARFLKFRS